MIGNLRGKTYNVWAKDPHACFPILESEWKNGFVGRGELLVYTNASHFEEALRMGAYLTCMYGGEITCQTNPEWLEKVDEKNAEKRKTEEEEVVEEVVEEEVVEEEQVEEEPVREIVKINSWLYAYKGEPTPPADANVLKQEDLMMQTRTDDYGGDWYSYDKYINDYVDDQYDQGGPDYDLAVYDENLAHVNNLDEHRYWIAVGPMIMDSKYNDLKPNRQTIDQSQFKYGTKIDVVLEHMENEDEKVYIECILGEVKRHTYPYGLFHTGVPYNYQEGEPIYEADGSYIEFLNKYYKQLENGSMSKYVVSKIIVYEREW